MKISSVVITGSSTYGVKNHGDDAMLATLVQGLKAVSPAVKITFLCRHPDADYDRVFGFQSLKNLDHNSKVESAGRLFFGFNPGDPDEHLKAIVKALSDADLLIIGGNSFMEIFPNEFLKGVSSYAVTLALIAKFLGTPFALYGANVVDKIRQDTTRDHARFLVGNASAVTLRENSGKQLLLDAGVCEKNLHVLGDPAFGIEAREFNVQKLLDHQGISLNEKPVIGVSFRLEYWSGEEDSFSLVCLQVAAALNEIIDRLKVQVLLIPNCTYTHGNKWQDDRLVHREIKSHITQKNQVFCVEEELTIFETLALYSLLDMHISNRRHSCVFAALNAVPFIAIDVSLTGHMRPFVTELGVPDQLIKFESSETIEKMALGTWDDREAIKKKMAPNVDRLIKSARTHIPIILESCS